MKSSNLPKTDLAVFKSPKLLTKALLANAEPAYLFNGDCLKLLKAIPSNSIDLIITSPPYCIGKEYEKGWDIESFKKLHKTVIPQVVRILKPGGSMCWEVGYHVKNSTMQPLDFLVHGFVSSFDEMKLRNRIIWAYGHGLHGSRRFSGRHETILWYTKGDTYKFNLDPVRIPQKYPGKTYYNGPKKGEPSGHPLGKNPSDIWDDIPNVKANHIEKTLHPCQFPIALAERLILALSDQGDIVFDPFAGVFSTGVASLRRKRRFVGSELSNKYLEIGKTRLMATLNGSLRVRELEKPIFIPQKGSKVATAPEHFATFHSNPELTERLREDQVTDPLILPLFETDIE
jgi:adenine-specific DNA-methyltransferase